MQLTESSLCSPSSLLMAERFVWMRQGSPAAAGQEAVAVATVVVEAVAAVGSSVAAVAEVGHEVRAG